MDTLNKVDNDIAGGISGANRMMQAVIALWLTFGAGLLLLGLDGTLFGADQTSQQFVGLSRAVVVVLLLATLLCGGIWATRTWDRFPPKTIAPLGDSGLQPRWHGAAAIVSLVFAALAFVSLYSQVLWLAATISAFWAFCVGPRWLTQVRSRHDSNSIPTFAVMLSYQATIGWLHLFDWGMASSMLLVLEGVGVIAATTLAVRAIPDFGQTDLDLTNSAPANATPQIRLNEPAMAEKAS